MAKELDAVLDEGSMRLAMLLTDYARDDVRAVCVEPLFNVDKFLRDVAHAARMLAFAPQRRLIADRLMEARAALKAIAAVQEQIRPYVARAMAKEGDR